MFLDLYLEKSLNLTRPLFSLEKSLSWGIEWNLLLSFTFYFNSQLVFQFHLSNLFSLSPWTQNSPAIWPHNTDLADCLPFFLPFLSFQS
jgi:hypothetical protein